MPGGIQFFGPHYATGLYGGSCCITILLIGRSRSTSLKSCKCDGCTRPECGKCKMCLDKPKYGGPGKKKQRCLYRQCVQRPKPVNQKKPIHEDSDATCIVKGFSMCITQSDMATLTGHLTWLNDQVSQ